MRNLTNALRGAALALCGLAVLGLSGCNTEVQLPTVTLTLPLASNALVPDVSLKDDKLSFELPEVCDLPDLAALEEEVREALGPAGGLIVIEAVLLDNIKFSASSGNFDFLDTFILTFSKDDESLDLSADLSGLTNITQFELAPDENEEIDIIELLPGPDECLQAEIDFTGSVPSGATRYNATMQVSILSVLRL